MEARRPSAEARLLGPRRVMSAFPDLKVYMDDPPEKQGKMIYK